MGVTFNEAQKFFRRNDRSINTNLTIKVHVYIGHHTDIDDETPLPELLSDQDCYVEIALPPDPELQSNESYEVIGRLQKEDKNEPISLDDVLRLFHINPDEPIWELETP